LLVTSVANDAMRQMTNIIDQESISRKADIWLANQTDKPESCNEKLTGIQYYIQFYK
jgi:hypothetical protein